MCSERAHVAVRHIVVVKCSIVGLIELCRIGNVLVISYRTGVYTPFGIDIDDRVLRLRFLGGDHDDSVRSSCTVQRIGSGILQDRHWLDIARVQVAQVAWIRHTVHNPERIVSCIEWAESADTDRRAGARLTWSVGQLHTCNLTSQWLSPVGLLRFGDVLWLDYRGRSSIGIFLRGTESHDDSSVDNFWVFLKSDIDCCFSAYRNNSRLKTDRWNLKNGIGRGWHRVVSIYIWECTILRTFDHNWRSDNRFTGWIWDCTGYLDVLSLDRYCESDSNK